MRKKLGKLSEKELKLIKEKSTKFVYCRNNCGRQLEIDYLAESGLCSICTTNLAPPNQFLLMSKEELEDIRKKTKKFNLKGWHLMKKFVDKEGNVFEYGKENSELKGQFPITDIDAIKQSRKKDKKTTREKNLEEVENDEELAKRHRKKRQIQKRQREDKQKKLEELSTDREK